MHLTESGIMKLRPQKSYEYLSDTECEPPGSNRQSAPYESKVLQSFMTKTPVFRRLCLAVRCDIYESATTMVVRVRDEGFDQFGMDRRLFLRRGRPL